MRFWAWLLSLFSPPPPPAPEPPPPDPGLLVMLNRARAAQGKPALTADPKLDAAAQRWAEQMARTGILTHGDYYARVSAVYPNSPTAENIAEGYPDSAAVVAAWLGDGPHRRNMLGPYTRVGVGRAGSFWVADFVL